MLLLFVSSTEVSFRAGSLALRTAPRILGLVESRSPETWRGHGDPELSTKKGILHVPALGAPARRGHEDA